MDGQRPSDDRLSAWLDGELAEAERLAVEHWLREHPDDAARVRLWAADRAALRARFDPVLEEPVPAQLLHTVRSGGRDGHRRWRPPPAMAAGLAALVIVSGAAGGWIAWVLKPAPSAAEALMASTSWTHRAAVAHAVYAPEVRHPVEVDTRQGDAAERRAQEEHLARWLGRRLEMPVKLFDLRSEGFELVGGRLLPDLDGPSAQLMYQNADGQRITFYLRRPESGVATGFRFHRERDLGMFYWIEEGFGCAVVGRLPRERLLKLAETAYRQIEGELPAAKSPPRPGT